MALNQQHSHKIKLDKQIKDQNTGKLFEDSYKYIDL